MLSAFLPIDLSLLKVLWMSILYTLGVVTVALILFGAGKQYINRPRTMPIFGKTLLLGSWLNSIDYIYRGADRIAEGYINAKTVPFAIKAFSCFQVLVSAKDHVRQLASAPDESLSFRKAMNDRLFFRYTMAGFLPDKIDPHNLIPIQVFKGLVRQNLRLLSQPIESRVSECLQQLFEKGRISNGTSKVSLTLLAGNLVARMNNQLLFGTESATNPDFERDSIKYTWHSSIAMEIFRQLPGPLVPPIAFIFMTCSGAMHRLHREVQALVDNRLAGRRSFSRKGHCDATEWVISSSNTPEQIHPLRLSQQMMALLFASTHQMQMALFGVIADLCTYPQYIKLLRSEAEMAFSSQAPDPYGQLRLLDCFLRESSRLNPLDSLNVQRKVVKPFTFSDGVHIPAGNLIAIPQREMMRDPCLYASPGIFDPYRFMPASEEEAVTKYTDVKWSYTFWGSPHKPCPGRWYASHAIKHVIVQLVMTYEIELLRPESKKWFNWTTAIVPRGDVQVLMRKRD